MVPIMRAYYHTIGSAMCLYGNMSLLVGVEGMDEELRGNVCDFCFPRLLFSETQSRVGDKK